MLKLVNVSKFYYNKGMISTGFNKVSLELKLGEFVAITGESGSGKSTLLNVISGIDSYEEGEMYINGEETSHYTEKDFENYRRKYVANIFQNFNLVNSYTVYQNVELVLLINGYKKHEVKKKILDIINQVGLEKFKNTRVSKLSGGQKQRVAIARAMVKDTPIIVADEPTGNLDSKSAKEVIEILKKVAKDKLVIIVTHNIEQVENVATRIIKMHDGKIIENVEIKNVEEEKEIKTSKYSKMSLFNEYRLGMRNTFNIVSKFLLLFFVFFFFSSAILTEYASFQMSESENENGDNGFSPGFVDLSKNRIIINKKDGTFFTNEDYEKINNMENVDYIVKDDILIDSYVFVNRDDMTFAGTMIGKNVFRGNLDLGRMPEKDNEIILNVSKEHFYIKDKVDDVLNKTFNILKLTSIDSSVNEPIQDVIIVGIKYTDDSSDYKIKFYVSDSILNKVRSMVNKNYSTCRILFNNKFVDYELLPSEKVESGKAIVDDNFKYEFKNYKIINQPISIYVSNIYYKKELNINVSNTYAKKNLEKLTGYKNYENNAKSIFVNTNDYNSLFDTMPYQSSVYVKDVYKIDETLIKLQDMGLNPKKVTDFKLSVDIITKTILKIIKVVVTSVLIIILFFISYLIIKIILKSRNIYYSTLRMLGATFKNVRKILNIELFMNSTLSYIVLLGFIYVVKTNIIHLEIISKLAKYLRLKEYVMMYIVLFIVSRLITAKFTKKLFKNSALSTYNEEI